MCRLETFQEAMVSGLEEEESLVLVLVVVVIAGVVVVMVECSMPTMEISIQLVWINGGADDRFTGPSVYINDTCPTPMTNFSISRRKISKGVGQHGWIIASTCKGHKRLAFLLGMIFDDVDDGATC